MIVGGKQPLSTSPSTADQRSLFGIAKADRSGRAHLHSSQDTGRPGLDNGVWFIGCPCALGFPFITTTHSRLVSSSFHVFSFVPLTPRTHTYTSAGPLDFLLPPLLREACV